MTEQADLTNPSDHRDCPFCRAALGHAPLLPTLGGAIYQDDLVLARHNGDGDGDGRPPFYLGSIIVQTIRHTGGGVAELSDRETQATGLLVSRIGRALKVTTGAAKIYAYTFGEAFPHLHTVVARYPGTPPAY